MTEKKGSDRPHGNPEPESTSDAMNPMEHTSRSLTFTMRTSHWPEDTQ